MPFDDRIIKIVLSYGTAITTIDTSEDPANPMAIYASGSKFADITQNECTVSIANLSRPLRNALATNLTPADYNSVRKSIQVWAGRVSTGMFLRYEGDIISAVPTQPPDISMVIRSKTMQFFKQDILAQSYAVTTTVSQIAQGVAATLGAALKFEATDKNISNYSYTGSAIGQVAKLSSFGSIDAYVDDGTLVCKNKGVPLDNAIHAMSIDSGMVGQVELTEWGVRVKALLSPDVKVGGTLRLVSIQNPSLNGDYTIYKTGFEIASRDVPFYDVIEATRYPAAFYSAIAPT